MNNQLKSLQEVIPPRSFVIPDYQRGYAWKDEHREDLLGDLRDLDALPDRSKMHYTGTLVLHRGRHKSKMVLGRSFDVLDVIDGQQRLTTLVILLSVLARRLEEIGTDDAMEAAKNLRADYVAYKSVEKLTPNGDAAAFFRDHVMGTAPLSEGKTPPEKMLLAARKQFEAFVDKHLKAQPDAASRLAWLDCWSALVTTRLGFVVFEVADEADVGVMFEAMNARGKALTQSELVKNYLLFVAAKVFEDDALTTHTRDVNDTWKAVVTALDAAGLSDADDTFLRYHWWIWPRAKGPAAKPVWETTNVHAAVKSVIRVIDGSETVSARMRDYLLDMRGALTAFIDLSRPERPGAFGFAGTARGELVEHARNIDRIGRSALVIPLLMASVLRFADDAAGLTEVLRLTETFVFRLSLMGRRSNAGESSVMSLARTTRATATKPAEVHGGLRDFINRYAPDKDVELALLEPDGSTADGNYYEWAQLLYLLFEYERELVTKKSQKMLYDWNAFYRKGLESIEHILPQGDNTLGVPYWKKRFTAKEFDRNRHRLGNLTLSVWNSSYGNRGFDQKCGPVGAAPDEKVYRNSKLECERELAHEAEWNEDAIARRQKHIAKFAMARWRA